MPKRKRKKKRKPSEARRIFLMVRLYVVLFRLLELRRALDEFIAGFKRAVDAGYTGVEWKNLKPEGDPLVGMLVEAGVWVDAMTMALQNLSAGHDSDPKERISGFISKLLDVPAEWVRLTYLQWTYIPTVEAVTKAVRSNKLDWEG